MFFAPLPERLSEAANDNEYYMYMGISELTIVKRDGKREAFSVEKIKRAVSKAFLAVGGYATDDDLTLVLSRVRVSDGMSVEEIQNQVETALMAERYFAVAKSFILYRQ